MYNSRLEKTTLRFIYFLAAFCIILFLLSTYHRFVTVDDAWFAEQSYWFAHDGYVHSDLFEGFPIFANQILVYHKLHIWQGALAYRLFGWSAYTFKSIPLLYLILFLGLIYYFLKYLAPVESRKSIFLIFLFFLFTNHLVFQEGFEYRPEIMMMCAGFLSYIFLYHAQLRQDYRYAILAGLLSGIAALFHLNGLIFIAAGGLLLAINKQNKLILWFGLGSIIGFVPYFFEISSIEKFKDYLYALDHDPAVSEEDRTLLGMLKKLVFEYRRFTHHVYESVYLLVFSITLIGNWKDIIQNQQHKNLLIYTVLLTVFMALITTGSKTSYLLYSMPYVLLLISIHFTRVLQIKKLAPLFLTFILIYFLANLDRDIGVFKDEKYESPDLYAHIIDKYHIKPGQQIFAPITFIFNEMGKVRIQSYLAYLKKYHNDLEQINLKNVFGDIYRRNKAYAILKPNMLKDMEFTPHRGKVYEGYQYLGREKNLYIFRRLSNANGSTQR